MKKEHSKLKLEIEVCNIEIKDGYYSFYYIYTLNGKKKKKSYDSDYDGWTEKQWKEMLIGGEAIKIALEEIANNFD